MAGEPVTSYSVDNDRIFRDALTRARKAMGDLTIPLTLISKDFYRSEKAIWGLKGPGLYPDLAESTKAKRRREKQPLYPILKRSGLLEKSMTDPANESAINKIEGKTALLIGTKLQYGIFHQSDRPRKKIPQRKFLFIGPEAKRFATSDQVGRLQRWIGILTEFAKEKASIVGEVN